MCEWQRCKKDICQIFDTCELVKKFGVKKKELTPLEQAFEDAKTTKERIKKLEMEIVRLSEENQRLSSEPKEIKKKK